MDCFKNISVNTMHKGGGGGCDEDDVTERKMYPTVKQVPPSPARTYMFRA